METQTQHVTKDMTMGEIMDKYPFAAEVMQSYGLQCVGCSVNPYESLENGALGHGMDDDQVESMVNDLNALIEKRKDETYVEEKKPFEAKLEITEFAAQKVKEIMATQKATGGLRVGVVRGGCSGKTYQMDFEETHNKDDYVFEQNGLKMFVDPKSMEFLTGTTIDYVEGLQGAGFKLNNPNETGGCGCGKSVK